MSCMMAFADLLATCRADYGLGYGQALTTVLVFMALSGVWLRALSGLRFGTPRLLAVLPIVLGNCAAPRLFCRGLDATTIMLAVFNTAWLASFKAVSWAVHRGPLVDKRLSLSQFLAVYMAPITPKDDEVEAKHKKGRLAEDAGGAGSMLGAWLGKLGLIAAVIFALRTWPEMPSMLRSFLLTWGLYGLLSAIMDGPAVLLTGLLGLQVSPHFDKPWLSNSTASWWNKRWDLAAGNTLRTLIFDPIVEGRLVRDPKVAPARNKPLRQLLASTASFGTSGLIHEAIYWYLMGTTTGGLWMMYFLSQVPIIVAERVALAVLKGQGVMLPNVVRIVITIGVQTAIGNTFWWPVAMGPLADQMMNNIKAGAQDAAAPLLQLLDERLLVGQQLLTKR